MAESTSGAEKPPVAGQGEAPTRGGGSVDPTLALPVGTKAGAPGGAGGQTAMQLGVYELIEKVGQGGMGAVWKARHTKLDKLVALKILPQDLMSDENAVARFEREMKAVGKLEHAHIVRAMDAGEAAGIHYLVMEYVEGVDLAKLVQNRGPRPVAEACQMIRHAALGLAHAHEHGMVHRDIKPSNLLLWKKGLVKILDLGLARLASERSINGESLTAQGEILGTPDYMAPEQWNSPNEAGPPADLYALGCTLVFLLTGRHLFGDEKHSSFTQKMKGHLLEAPPRLQQLRPDVPQELDALCQRLLAKLPEDRPQSAKQVATELQAMLKRWSKTAPASDAIAWTPPQTPAEAAVTRAAVKPARPRVRYGWVAAVVGICLVVSAGAWLVSANRPGIWRQSPKVASLPPQPVETGKDQEHAEKATAEKEAAANEQARKLYGLGRELCFVKDDWKLGMPLLAEGHDAGVRAAAAKEIEGILTPETQADAGILWYAAGQGIKEPVDDNWHCFRRARYWLTRATKSGTQRTEAWWDQAQRTLDLIPVLRAPVVIKLHSFNTETIIITRNEIEWISRDGSGPNEISSPRTGMTLPAFRSKYPGEDRHTFGREEVRKVMPEGVDFTLARLRVNHREGTTSPWTTALIVPERSDDTKVTIRVGEWDAQNNRPGNYQGDFKFELTLGWGEGAGGKGKK